jgi:hypothetical protein
LPSIFKKGLAVSDLDVNRSINAFLETRGVSLMQFGSAEFAISRADAILFLDLLDGMGKKPLGMETWRRLGEKFTVDSLGGWYSNKSTTRDNLKSAKEFLCNELIADNNFVTIQFN